jgi:hypothetical protein
VRRKLGLRQRGPLFEQHVDQLAEYVQVEAEIGEVQ